MNIENNCFIKQKEKKEETDNTNENEKNDYFNKNIVNIQVNNNDNDSFNDEISLFNYRNDYPLPDLSLPNNFSSRSLSRFFK